MSDAKQSALPKSMKAIGFTDADKPNILRDTEPLPTLQPRDLLIRILSVATNPVDGKARKMYKAPAGETDEKKLPIRIVGWDFVGIVAAKGSDSKSEFKLGDRVYGAGSLIRAGCFAEYVAVDERICALAPNKLSNNEAATVPLCALTAWEALTEQMHIAVPTTPAEEKHNATKSLLIINGAGGVGSIAAQIAKKVLKIGHVIATASRQETIDWCKSNGADVTINHRQPLLPQLKGVGREHGVDYIFNCGDADQNFTDAVTCIGQLGTICIITGLNKPVDVSSLFLKRATLTFELMFTRPMTGIELERQGTILSKVAGLIESGVLKHTMKATFEWSVDGLTKAGQLQDGGAAIGKAAIMIAAK